MNNLNSHYGIEPSFPLHLDNTQINNFRSCEEKFHLYSLLEQVGSGINPHLNSGGAFAVGMDVWRKEFYGARKTYGESLGIAVRECIRHYGMYEPPQGKASEEAKTWDRVAAGIISYLENWRPEEDHLRPAVFDGTPSSEFSFAVPLPINHPDTGEPLLYSGVFDAVMRFGETGWDPDKDYTYLPLYGYDDKTTYQMGAGWSSDWIMRGQFIGYFWAARQLGFDLKGFIVRGTAFQKTQIKHAEAILYFPPWKVEQWYSNLLATIEKAITTYKTGYFGKNWGDACAAYGGCSYKILCDSDSPHKWIQTHFKRRTWSPIDLEKL